MTEPLIGVGVPVWRGAAFVVETLQSILDQQRVRFKVVVSIDGADAESERACRPFASDPRVRIIMQPRRLGWVRNTAAALAAACDGAEFVCVQPHDDWIEPDYLEVLLDAVRNCPQTAVAFCDLVTFGALHGIPPQDSVTGTPVQRQLTLLGRHYNAPAFRGLTRASALARVPPISGNQQGDFACDTVWMARLARTGELMRVPRALYHKRYHAGSAHAAWSVWPAERKIAAWTQHCLDMLAEALIVTLDPDDRWLLIEAARRRLVLADGDLGPYAAEIRAMPSWHRFRMRARVEAGA